MFADELDLVAEELPPIQPGSVEDDFEGFTCRVCGEPTTLCECPSPSLRSEDEY